MTLFPDEMFDFVKANVKGKSQIEITQLVNDHFGTSFTLNQVKAYKHRFKLSSGLTGRFEKGRIPTNGFPKGHYPANAYPKGHYPANAYPKGHKPWNYAPVGTEVFKDDGYLWTKIEEPNKWKQNHVMLWEAKHGKRPKGMKIIFLDGNKSNIVIENLALVENAEMLILNKRGLIHSDPELTTVGVSIAKLVNKTNNLQRGKK